MESFLLSCFYEVVSTESCLWDVSVELFLRNYFKEIASI